MISSKLVSAGILCTGKTSFGIKSIRTKFIRMTAVE